VEFPDGSRPKMVGLEDPIDYLRTLKDYPRLLIEQMQKQQMDNDVVEQLNGLLPDRWLKAHPESYLPLNRRSRVVGAA
jgi:hypothetical protein